MLYFNSNKILFFLRKRF